jgi:serine phosphatase RsbU (regulator of sigma subunit)
MKIPFSGLRFRLVALVMLGGLPSLALTFYTAAEQRRLAATEIQQNALRVARLASAGQERLIEGARQLLLIMSHLPELRESDPAAANAMLADLLRQYPLYTNFGVIELDGSVFASGVKLPAGVNLADRTYFIRTVENRAFAMGDYQVGRITGKSGVNFASPILDPDGKIRRVVFAALDLSWLEQHAAEAELPSGASLTVVDGTGTILVRWPEPARWRGKSLADEEIWKTISQTHQGTTQAVGTGGVPLLFAFTQLKGAKGAGFVSVNIGIPTEVAYAEADRMLKRNLTLLCCAGVLAVAAAWFGGDRFILRRVKTLVHTTRRLEAGELYARTDMRYGGGELGLLAHAFDAMATSLQQRGAERDRAEADLKQLNQELERRVAERTLELREKNEQLEADIVLAREFQIALLPKEGVGFPAEASGATASLQFYHIYQASGAVGGDFFDVFPLSETAVGIAICDVMGHGVRAALVTAIMRGLFEEFRSLAIDPGNFLTAVNRELSRLIGGTGTTMFVTACYLVIDLESYRISFANAGHPWPLHLRHENGVVESLQPGSDRPGPALGLVKKMVFRTMQSDLAAGDLVVLFTDGLFEINGPDNVEFGPSRLKSAIASRAGQHPDRLLAEVFNEARDFSAEKRFEDDVCIVGIELRAAEPGNSSGAGLNETTRT